MAPLACAKASALASDAGGDVRPLRLSRASARAAGRPCLSPYGLRSRFSRSPKLVGLGRLERPTSPLSGVRSNHLSYRPPQPGEARKPRPVALSGEERETKAAKSRQSGPDRPRVFQAIQEKRQPVREQTPS